MMHYRFIAPKSGRIMSSYKRFTTLLQTNTHAKSEKNKAAARKIDNLITIPKRSGTYPTTATDLQEHLCIVLNNPVATRRRRTNPSRLRTRGWLCKFEGSCSGTAHRAVATARYEIRSIVDRPIHSDSGTIFFPVM